MTKPHTSDGSDREGAGLEVTIRIGPDGAVYFHDLTRDLLPVALALCPDEPSLRRRSEAAAGTRKETPR